jgi:ribosomal protein S12 methylthiotransferase accessory factor
MLRRPVLKSHIHWEVVPGDGVFLFSEHGHRVLYGEIYEELARVIDGRLTSDEIADRLQARFEPTEVYYALLELEAKGYVAESPGPVDRTRTAYWHSLNADPGAADSRVTSTTIAVHAIGAGQIDECARLLEQMGYVVRGAADFNVVLVDDYLRSELEDFNASALEQNLPWVLLKPTGTVPWIGPIFKPGATGCWKCLAERLKMNRQVEAFVAAKKELDAPIPVGTAQMPWTLHAAIAILATEIGKWLGTGGRSELVGSVISWDTGTLEMARHIVPHRPQCPACGDPDLYGRTAGESPALRARKRHESVDGGYRTVTPGQLLRRYGHLVSPITGVARPFRKLTVGTGSSFQVYAVGPNPARTGDHFHALRADLRNQSSGKGLTDAQARASALGEAVERHSCVFQGDEPHIRASYTDIAAEAIAPNEIMLFSDAQYRERDAWNSRESVTTPVPIPFEPDVAIDWSPVWSLTGNVRRYIPTMLLYYRYPTPEDQLFGWADSNGSAAGASVEEALLQGLLELVERDATAIWWYNRLERPAVDLETLDSPYCRELQAAYRSLNREFWVLDITSDLGIPTFAAITRELNASRENILPGLASHIDPQIALMRSLSEMNQMVAAYQTFAGAEDTVAAEFRSWLKNATVANQTYLYPSGESIQLSDVGSSRQADLLEDILYCQRTLEARGLEVLMLDQTRPDIEMPVVKVLAPGLRHFWARFAPGRLYDVPLAMGWIAQVNQEAQLNPIPFFL